MKLKNYIFIVILFILSGCSYQSTPSSKVLSEPEVAPASITQKVETIATAKPVPKKKPDLKIIEKKYPGYTAIGTWKLGESFSDLLPKIKDMKYEIDGEEYGSTIAFYDDDQYLYFRGGILSYVIVYKNGQGIKNGSVVGDSVKQLLNTMGKPLVKHSDNEGMYYGYGTSYSEQELNFKISNSKVTQISLENYTEGFPSENRGVLMYLNSIGDPAADYYVCNTCSSEEEEDTQSKVIDSNLTTAEINEIFKTITNDLYAYPKINSTKQSDYTKVFTEELSTLEERLNEVEKNSISQPNHRLILNLEIYCRLVYDVYSQKAMSLAPELSKFEKARYETQADTSLKDAITLHGEIATYLYVAEHSK